MAQRSRLLILDEPTTGLDPVVMDELLRLLVEDCTAEGRTILLSTHQLTEIEQIADYIGILDRGKLLLEGRLDDIRDSFRRVTVTGFSLPARNPSILSLKPHQHGTQYVLRDAPTAFLQELESNGATIVESAPLSLTEIGAFPILVIRLPTLPLFSRSVSTCILMLPGHGFPLSWTPSPLSISMHFAFAAVVLVLGCRRMLRSAELERGATYKMLFSFGIWRNTCAVNQLSSVVDRKTKRNLMPASIGRSNKTRCVQVT